MPATVEFGAIQWLELPPEQTVAPAGIASSGVAGRATLALGIQVTAIQSGQVLGTTQVIPAPITITAHSIRSGQSVGAVVVEVITEGARVRLVAIYWNGYAVAGYQKRYLGYVSEQELMAAASYQKRYLGYVLEHEFIAAARELVEA